MIPRFAKAGRSFKGVVTYLVHDAGHAATSERVAWTHTLNSVHDNVPAAMQDMITTWRNAELLKEEAGLGKSGPRTEKPVKHISLNWHPAEVPDREAMIAGAEGFLKAMGWDQQPAILIAHNDRPHSHVHIVLSAIDPETGAKIDDRFEFRRAQKWAAVYEQQRGQDYCPQRSRPAAAREPSPPRPVWKILEESLGAHRHAEAARQAGGTKEADAAQGEAADLEWKALKQLQREEREAFMASGKQAYGALRDDVYRMVRKELKHEWRALYAGARAGADRLAIARVKEALIARQSDMLRARIAVACVELRQERDEAYRVVLAAQQDARTELRAQQARGERAFAKLAGLAESQQRRLPPGLERVYGPHAKGKAGSRASSLEATMARWTEKGGMAAQQRSAFHWIDRAAARATVRKMDEHAKGDAGRPSRAVAPGTGMQDRHRNGRGADDDKGFDAGPD